jgi:hypothetical protein
VCVEVLLGIEVGLFYSVHMLRTGSLRHGAIMHCTNNLLSAFWPPNVRLHSMLSDPLMLSIRMAFAITHTHVHRVVVSALDY